MLTNEGIELFQLPGPTHLIYLHWMGVPLEQLFHQRMHRLQRIDLFDS